MTSEINTKPDNTKLTSTKIRWYQYSLRTLLIFMLLVSILMSYIAVRKRHAERQQEIVAALRKKYVGLWYDYQSNGFGSPEYERPLTQPQFLLDWLGIDFFHSVVGVGYSVEEVSGKGRRLKTLPFEDDDLQYLLGLEELKVLHLDSQPISDHTLEQIQRLNKLEKLGLAETNITDEGLRHLDVLKNLKIIYLNKTSVTLDGIKRMQKMHPGLEIKLHNQD
jgi:hypothetical protein